MTDSTLRRALDRSVVGSRLGTTSGRHDGPSPLRTAARDARVAKTVRRASERGRRAANAAAVGRLGSHLAAWTDRARVTRAGARGAAAVRASWLYRWLTAEPDPDVVVIDLRETITVAPFIAAVDASVRALLPAVARSTLVRAAGRTDAALPDEPVRNASLLALGVVLVGVVLAVVRGLPDVVVVALALLAVMALVGTQVRRSWDELVESWVADIVRAALEPPEPPADPRPADETAHHGDEESEETGATPDRRPGSE